MGRCRLAAAGGKGSCVRPLGAAWRYFGRILCLVERDREDSRVLLRRRKTEEFSGGRGGRGGASWSREL